MLLLFSIAGFAQKATYGTSEDCKWKLAGTSGNYTLTISGKGAMADYSSSGEVPWYDSSGGITAVVINNGVRNIGTYAFYGCSNLTSVAIPGSVANIGGSAFQGCSSLMSVAIPFSVTSIRWGDF